MLIDLLESSSGCFAIDNELIDIVYFEFYLEVIKKGDVIISYDTLSDVKSSLGGIKNKKEYFKNLSSEDCKSIALAQYEKNTKLLKGRDVTVSYHLPLSAILDAHFIDKMISKSEHRTAFEIDQINIDLNSSELVKDLLLNIEKIKKCGGEIWLNDYIHTSKSKEEAVKKINFDLVKLDKKYWWMDGRFNDLFKQVMTMRNSVGSIVVKGVESDFQFDLVKRLNVMAQGSF
ncbi:EAL domain-containing protein [Vibrio harveyi]|uniref:EAL domain-containing protein n=1 Tax=Vibrio harveyi TaxID=669 RepID=UPI0003A8893C|nr:EAL domain-containing protein [Vibrio harveyi]MBY7699333.1 EAL domain-containing protein [Vibrio harveyi]PNM62574.1 EAL domain-containing protein [Vibrio harveyi]UIL56468.1 EAL domain-containing protein [Vibrio harveyi]SQA36245.1 EAL family protein [Vibrio harveyi]